VVIGSGPNGLAAGITLARAGRSVLMIEAKETIGGGSRSAELTLPGFIHDVCSTIQSFGMVSPFMRSVPFLEFGIEFVYPPSALAHPLDDGTAVMLEGSLEATAEHLGRDGEAYRNLMGPLLKNWDRLFEDLLGPLPLPPKHPLLMLRFGLSGFRSAQGLVNSLFKEKRARALFGGNSAHSIQRLDRMPTAAFGLMLSISAHKTGWPVARRGSQTLADGLGAYFKKLGGEIVTGWCVETLEELPRAESYFFDVTPHQLGRIAGKRLPSGYLRQLERYRYGPGVFKIDFALSDPVPWKAKEAARAATVHLGGTFEEIATGEREVWEGKAPERPFILAAQQTLFDPTRAPEGKHTLWAYCHVPHGSTVDMTGRIEAQFERFAPGFRDCILAKSTMTAVEMESYNPNYVGGDINAGVQDLFQLFTRPTLSLKPYATPVKGIFLCSSSTPPGGGVHGLGGYHAARLALKK
jgi:phytoene dehydrogenase-like protein